MSIEERAENFRAQIKNDMSRSMSPWLPHQPADVVDALTDALVEDPMFHIEHLLVEIENLQTENRLLREENS